MESKRKWFYAVNGERRGPVTEEEIKRLLRERILSPISLVWHPDFGQEWRTIRTVPTFMANQVITVNLQTTEPLTGAPRPVLHDGFVHFGSKDSRERIPMGDIPGENSSAWSALSHAFVYMKEVLFRSSSIAHWFSLGFCLWISQMGSRGLSVNPPIRIKPDEMNSLAAFKGMVDESLKSLSTSLSDPEMLSGLAVTLLVSLAFAFLFLWLESRGIFMFLYRWYRPDASISEAWMQSRRNNRSFFLWRACYSLVMIFFSAGLSVFLWKAVAEPYLAAGCVWQQTIEQPLMIAGFGFLTLSLVGLAVKEILYDFVAPIMDAQDVGANEAWKAVFSLCNYHPLGVVGYFAVKAVCALAVAGGIGLLLVCTCCMAIIPLAMPFIGSVILLPVSFLFRGYSLFYLEGWRSELLPGVGVKR